MIKGSSVQDLNEAEESLKECLKATEILNLPCKVKVHIDEVEPSSPVKKIEVEIKKQKDPAQFSEAISEPTFQSSFNEKEFNALVPFTKGGKAVTMKTLDTSSLRLILDCQLCLAYINFEWREFKYARMFFSNSHDISK